MATKPKRAEKDAIKEKRPLPLGQRVMVEKLAIKEKKSPSGLIIPSSARDETPGNSGKIVALSPHLSEEWTNYLKAGDMILYSTINNDEVKLDGAAYTLVPTENILGKLP
jgi:chaperonin GroES